MKHTFLAIGLSIAAVVPLHAQPVFNNGYLVGENGKTLYTFDKDTGSQSNCKDACLVQWPAYSAKAGSKLEADFGTTPDGKHWTYRGKPLYFFVGDQNVGDRRGDQAGNVWRAVPAANPLKSNEVAPKKGAY
jgi:predicted lipoprotein with Yx(FWY)xxD motif